MSCFLRFCLRIKPHDNLKIRLFQPIIYKAFLTDEISSHHNAEKPNRLLAITRFFIAEHVETVADLSTWLSLDSNIPRLKQQRGIGDITADYFKILAGLQTTAVDRHLFKFLEEAVCPAKDYAEAQALMQESVDQLIIPYSILDHNIWQYCQIGSNTLRLQDGLP